jgi:hypothetical protein
MIGLFGYTNYLVLRSYMLSELDMAGIRLFYGTEIY